MDKMWNGYRIILASASPRRKELLAQIGLEPEIMPSCLDEAIQETDPAQMVMELSRQKAQEIAEKCQTGDLVIGADTVVVLEQEILGKPNTPQKAEEMLSKLQGRTHQVYTGVTLMLCLGEGKFHGSSFAEMTEVEVYPMSRREIQDYVATGDPLDKAGAYGIQGVFAAYIKGIRGDYYNVVGLPLGRVYQEMKNLTEEKEDDD